jgi:hypothetical protein
MGVCAGALSLHVVPAFLPLLIPLAVFSRQRWLPSGPFCPLAFALAFAFAFAFAFALAFALAFATGIGVVKLRLGLGRFRW